MYKCTTPTADFEMNSRVHFIWLHEAQTSCHLPSVPVYDFSSCTLVYNEEGLAKPTKMKQITINQTKPNRLSLVFWKCNNMVDSGRPSRGPSGLVNR